MIMLDLCDLLSKARSTFPVATMEPDQSVCESHTETDSVHWLMIAEKAKVIHAALNQKQFFSKNTKTEKKVITLKAW
jgi:hypothetical protein